MALRLAIQHRPDSVDAYLYLGESLASNGAQGEGVDCLETAARLAAPHDSRARDALARWRNTMKP